MEVLLGRLTLVPGRLVDGRTAGRVELLLGRLTLVPGRLVDGRTAGRVEVLLGRVTCAGLAGLWLACEPW